MRGSVAVVAHFDPDDRLDPTFRSVLACLREVCEQIVLVSTCSLPPSEIPTDPSIITIQRPNIGYDFYSYRVGINEIYRQGGCERLFVLNSSFLVLHHQRFISTLKEMIYRLGDTGVVGITESLQFEPHLQSYLILLKGHLLNSDWFQKWLLSIEPKNSKIETILTIELGFTRELAANNIGSTAIFCPNRRETLRAYYLWVKRQVLLNGLYGFKRKHLLRKIKEYNPVHFAARALAEQCGLVKSELLRDNPNCLDNGWVDKFTSMHERDAVREFIERSRQHYHSASNGLTVFKNGVSCLPHCRIVYSSPLARPGVRAAVVVHIFYPELIDEICTLLQNILEPFDLFITTPHEGAISVIFDRCTSYAQSIAVILCENRGRDIGPFMAIHRRKLLDPYQAVLKLHTKKSKYSDQGDFWRQSLYRELCGDSLTVQHSLDMFRQTKIGLVGPHSSYLTHQDYWGADLEKAKILLASMNIRYETVDPPLGFFAGSMFWFNPKALIPLHAIPDEQLAFEPESGLQDGTLAHAFERIFCNIVRSSGFVATSVELEGAEIDETNSYHNTIPVLASTSVDQACSLPITMK